MYVYWRLESCPRGSGESDCYDVTAVLNRSVSIEESLRLYGQVNKRTWWMPWQPEAMKDVVDNENLGEPSNRL